MDTMQVLGIKFLVGLQELLLGPLEGPMHLITQLGEERFYMIALTFIFWCVHRGLGFRLLMVLLFTAYVNALGKWIIHRPRPYWFDPAVKGMVSETSYGPPSGHSQNPMSVWGYCAAWLYRRGVRWAWPAALVVIFLIGFSRMVLGVHFPHALALGWLLGALVAYIAWRLGPWAEDIFFGGGEGRSWAIAFALPALMLLGIYAVQSIFLSGVDPQQWAANAAVSQPDGSIAPHSLKTPVSLCASMCAMLVSLILIRRTGEVSVEGAWWIRLLRFVLGFGVLIAISLGLGAVFPKGEGLVGMAFRFVRYFLMLLWGIYFAPLVFVKLKLARME